MSRNLNRHEQSLVRTITITAGVFACLCLSMVGLFFMFRDPGSAGTANTDPDFSTFARPSATPAVLALDLAGTPAAPGQASTMQDAFSDASGLWQAIGGAGAPQIADGKLLLAAAPGGQAAASSARLASMADVSVSVSAEVAADAGGSGFGVFCRMVDPINYYYAFVTGAGQAVLGKVQNGAEQILSGDTPIQAGIFSPGYSNQVQIVCQGERIDLAVNGQNEASVIDAAIKEAGQSGVLVRGSADAVQLDNFIFWGQARK